MRIFNFSGFRRAKLSCCLLPSSPKGVGIAMVLKFGLRGKSITQTCWESDFTPQFPVELKDPKNLYYFLCIPVSAFLVSRINKLRSRSAFRKWWRTYGTEDWESCALCQIGAALFLRNNFEPAKHAYRLALSKDARNHQAWYNLGTCFVRLWSEEGKALAEECFNKTIN